MEHRNVFYAKDRTEWRAWLSDHYQTATDIWFVFPNLTAEEPSVSYNDAVEEALCFGWIDTTAGRLDAKHSIRRFCKRRNGSTYSRPNIERLRWLNDRAMLLPEIQKSVLPIITAPYVFPQDIIAEIQKDKIAFENYERFSDSYKRIRIDYIDAARKRPDEFCKRLHNFIEKTRKNQLIIGYGGIDKYYQ